MSALQLLFQRHWKPKTDPLFCRVYGPFDRKWVIKMLSQALLFAGINHKGYIGHSFRRSAAVSALMAGIAKEDIMQMGRWKSDSIERYFSSTATNTFLFSLSRQLRAHPSPSSSISKSHSTTSNPRVQHQGWWWGLPSVRVPASWSDHSPVWLPEACSPIFHGSQMNWHDFSVYARSTK